jgi:hypothetical protein
VGEAWEAVSGYPREMALTAASTRAAAGVFAGLAPGAMWPRLALVVARLDAQQPPAPGKPPSLECIRLALPQIGCAYAGYAAQVAAADPSPRARPAHAPRWVDTAMLPARARRCGRLAGDSELGLRMMECSGCLSARYCDASCQLAAWPGHRAACKAARAARPR